MKSAIDTPPQVTEAHIRAFEEDGAVCLRSIIDDAWIDRMRHAIERVVPKEAGSPPRFVSELYLWKRDADFKAFCCDSPVAKAAAAVMRSQVTQLFADQLLVKEAGVNAPTPWHQDQPYWPVSGTQLCTVWVALDTVTLDSGAVEYVKGSHRWNKWYKPVSFDGSSRFAALDWEVIPDFDQLRDEHDFLHWDVEPGDCIIHHPLVVHGAGPNKQPGRDRRAIAPRYAGDDVRWQPYAGYKQAGDSQLKAGDRLDAVHYPVV